MPFQSIPEQQVEKSVLVRIRKENNNVLITVTDNGIGIQLKDIDRIFEPKFTTRVAEWV
jgi:signal transduction histidine kinase